MANEFKIKNGITIDSGQAVDEISTDGTLASNLDTALVTEKAIKKYVDDNHPTAPVTSVNSETGVVVLTTGDILEDTDVNVPTSGVCSSQYNARSSPKTLIPKSERTPDISSLKRI